MADRPPTLNERDQARQARLRQALRDNLKKRKSQLRGRADLAAAEAGVSSEPDSDADKRSRQDEPDRE
ncbi:hypothetical protein RPMA_03390 [Tardiphaga alba]|uniref:DUF4169 family protein n=1 Tax=Tardiphaga alba TaxID=340268 RepID=A0ABX8A6W1_9BRAD|nr:hypothetical protein [Tardiphaga alba]QUS38010.1 hypothetical protein RPMA_03390 [Tardiphaga alba]